MLHLLVAVVATGAVAFQAVLVFSGEAVLNDEVPPLATRLYRLAAYFTIQSNVLVAVTSWQLWRDPARDGRWWRPVRLAALVGITVTGLVHFVLLRPLLDLDGANWVVDKLLHMVVPVLAVLAWFLVGPRRRVTWRTVGESLVWPVVWTGWTLVVGALSGWYPYPFLNPANDGVGAVVVACLGITVLFLALFAGVRGLDHRLAPAPAGELSPASRAR
ncbi:Pr6Pr family membrane protein [Phycicoccus sp. MQZ13P-5]|uniref:Pr6Pr family membrane protein n=2 Tax=Phycicoccus sonneratiae TaxID=2807628 RepID=A0ABS2CHX2_9MICO|nr:Pr6Pr family membrane protein [Phycicoccus sonneraticus]